MDFRRNVNVLKFYSIDMKKICSPNQPPISYLLQVCYLSNLLREVQIISKLDFYFHDFIVNDLNKCEKFQFKIY